MKLRIYQNSIRLRLSRSEVERFTETGHIEDILDFGAMGKFTYSLTCSEEFTFHCIYDISGVNLIVPRTLAQAWAGSDRPNISAEQPLENGRTLQILVEKDFQCIHKTTDQDTDAFPNPLASKAS